MQEQYTVRVYDISLIDRIKKNYTATPLVKQMFENS